MAGVILRIVVAAFVSNTLDMRFYGQILIDGSFHRPLYQDALFSYPPLWGYVLLSLGRIASFVGVMPFHRELSIVPYAIPGLTTYDLTKPLFSLLIKMPILVGDALTAWLIWAFLRELGATVTASRAAVLAWWLNPLVFFGSAINASWDCVVPLAMMYAVLLAWRRAWFGSGVMIALGIFAKLAPLYAVLVVTTMALSRGRMLDWGRRLLLCAAGGVLTTLLAFAPIFYWKELQALRLAVFSRAGSFNVGGANLWALSGLHAFSWLSAWAQDHRAFVLDLSLAILLGGMVLTGIVTLLRQATGLQNYVRMLLVVVSLVLIASPFSQPTYVLWLLPMALVLAALGSRFWQWYALLQTIFASLFLYTVRSLQDLLMPLCAFTHACDPVAFATASIAYRQIGTPFADNLQITIDSISGFLVGVLTIAGCVWALYQIATDRTGASPSTAELLPYARLERPALVSLAALLLVSTTAVVPFPSSPSLTLQSTKEALRVRAVGFTGDLHIVRYQAPASPLRTIYVYADPHYPFGRGGSSTFQGGFPVHLADDLVKRQQTIRVVPIDAAGLSRLFNKPGAGRALTILDGILPSFLRGEKHDRFQAWIHSGGLVFWAGEPFAALYATPSIGGATPANSVLDFGAWRAWYREGSLFPSRVQPFSPPIMRGTLPVMDQPVANLTFARTTFALNIGPLQQMGGIALGFLDSRWNSSVSVIPYGRGTIVFFGDGFDDEIVAAQEIAQIVATGAWVRPFTSEVRLVRVRGSFDERFPPLKRDERAFVYGGYPDDGPFARAKNS